LAQPAEKSASYDSEINSEIQQSVTSLEKATSLCNLPTNNVPTNSEKSANDPILALSESLKHLNSSKTREKKNGMKTKIDKCVLPGALSLDSISSTSKLDHQFSDGRPREWSPKKKTKPSKSNEDEIMSSSSDEDECSSGDEFSLECNPPPIEKITELPPSLPERSDNIAQAKIATEAETKCENEEELKRKAEACQQQVIFRQHYLSIIQEEEEHSDANGNTPGSSRASSRPSSIYGLPSFNPNDLKDMFKGLNKEPDGEETDSGAQSETNSPSCKNKVQKETEAPISTNPNSKVNSILTNQAIDSMSLNVKSPESLQDILRKLPPPPKQPPSLKPLWSPDRRKKFAPDVKTANPQDSIIAEEHIYENTLINAKQRENNLRKFNQQMKAESLRSLSSSNSSFSYDDDLLDERPKPLYRTPPSPPRLLHVKTKQEEKTSPKSSPPRNTNAQYSPSGSPFSKSRKSFSPKNSPPVSPKLSSISNGSPPRASKTSPKLAIRTPPSPKKMPQTILTSSSSPKVANLEVSPQRLLLSNVDTSPQRVSNGSNNLRILNADLSITDEILNGNKNSSASNLNSVSKVKSIRSQSPTVSDFVRKSSPPKKSNSNPLPLGDAKINRLSSSEQSSTNQSEETNSKMSVATYNDSQMVKSTTTTQKQETSEKRRSEIRTAQSIISNAQKVLEEASKHLPKVESKSGNPESDRLLNAESTRTLERGRNQASRAENPIPKSILKETTKQFLADKEDDGNSSASVRKSTEEVSLEELIKKYNGPKRNSKEAESSAKPVNAKQLLRMRSASCNRPGFYFTNQFLQLTQKLYFKKQDLAL